MSSLKASNTRRKNHFVPAALLRPWLWPDNSLRGYWWDPRQARLRCKEKGVGAFCFQLDLLTTRDRHGLSDQLERDFESIDTPGITARDRLLISGARSLSVEQRCDFARLLMSLEVRRPYNVGKVKVASKDLRRTIDDDPDILEAFIREGIVQTPSEWWDSQSIDGLLHERSFASMIRNLTDRPDVGKRLINANWHIVELGNHDGTFLLTDRPLMRTKGFFDESAGWLWTLPLTPKHIFLATNRQAVLDNINKSTRRRFCKQTNVSCAGQAERFVFAADVSHEHWVGKYLAATPAASKSG